MDGSYIEKMDGSYIEKMDGSYMQSQVALEKMDGAVGNSLTRTLLSNLYPHAGIMYALFWLPANASRSMLAPTC